MSRPASRRKRMHPVRRGPIRNPLAPPAAPSGAHDGPAPDGFPHGASRRAPDPAEPIFGALENGVRTAYAVIDEYMRRGYQAAGSNHSGPNEGGPMDDKKTNYGNWQDPASTIAALTEQWLTMMRTWTDLWSSFIPRTWPQQAWSPGTTPAAPTVSVRVLSQRQTEVTARLKPGADLVELAADPLRTRSGHEPPIEGKKIVFTRAPGQVNVTVEIDDKQPSGRYTGAIRSKADNSEIGTLSVVIEGPQASASSL